MVINSWNGSSFYNILVQVVLRPHKVHIYYYNFCTTSNMGDLIIIRCTFLSLEGTQDHRSVENLSETMLRYKRRNELGFLKYLQLLFTDSWHEIFYWLIPVMKQFFKLRFCFLLHIPVPEQEIGINISGQVVMNSAARKALGLVLNSSVEKSSSCEMALVNGWERW